MLERCKSFCYVAEADGKIVGNVFGEHDGAFIASLRKLAVHESYRRQKIATQLTRKVIEKIDEIGIPLIYAHVEKTNAASIALSKSLGFEIRESHYLIDRGSPK